MNLDKAGLLAALQLKKKTVSLDSGDVIVTELSSADYIATYGSDAVKGDDGEFDGGKFTALLVTRCIVDAKGARLLADEDVEALRVGSTSVYSKLAAACKEVNGFGVSPKN